MAKCFGTDAVLKHKGCVSCEEMKRCLSVRISHLMDGAFTCLEDDSHVKTRVSQYEAISDGKGIS